MNSKEAFIKAGFNVVGTENNENKLLKFLKENYPFVIKDNEINIQELKAILGLPVDEKVNGYGLNFVGRNFARAKYAQKTDKELKINKELSKDFETTQNLVLKGDNLDCLKILKNHYSGKIKCIYIDPPYNTDSDEFVYPDKFDKEEAEVLGLQNLSEDDFARMEFSFKTKKSHNGWLAFMYPRLLLARDLLSDDGVIFISIDDNEVANLKLLCDEIFGEENFVGEIIRQTRKGGGSMSKIISVDHDYILVYSKNFKNMKKMLLPYDEKYIKRYNEEDEKGRYFWDTYSRNRQGSSNFYKILAPDGTILEDAWINPKYKFEQLLKEGEIRFKKIKSGKWSVQVKQRINIGQIFRTLIMDSTNEFGTADTNKLLGKEIFSYAKPVKLIKQLLISTTNNNDIILDFFAGSGTTGQAVMELNAEDGGNRKFILCQIDEPIKADKPAYKFCVENNLPPVISSITIERLKRAGEIIAKNIEAENSKSGMFEEHKKTIPDIGFKVFDSVEAPKLKVDDKGQISITENETDALSRIYNMIFTVGLDEPTQVPQEVVKDCIYKIGNHYYITNSEKITSDDYSNAIKNGKLFIDGWTASLNGTLLNYKEDVKIVF